MDKFDVGIIGGGPGGYTAALHAAAKGEKVVLFEKDNIGGVCLNKGCIPTKSILHSSEVYKQIINSASFGVSVENINQYNFIYKFLEEYLREASRAISIIFLSLLRPCSCPV